MNIERDKPDSGNDDRLVSTTYREIANESAPDALNQSILRQAAAAAKPRYARNMSWMRPMAWAATIGLSLAIVLEIMQVPQRDLPTSDLLEEAFESPPVDSRLREERKSTDFVEEMVVRDGPSANIESDSLVKNDATVPAALQVPQAVEIPEKKRANDFEPVLELEKASVASVADESRSRDSDDVGNAENIARLQSRTARESAPAVQAGYSSDAAISSVQRPGCDEVVMAEPVTWLECIEELEKSGLFDTANEELDRLKQAFPEFVLP